MSSRRKRIVMFLLGAQIIACAIPSFQAFAQVTISYADALTWRSQTWGYFSPLKHATETPPPHVVVAIDTNRVWDFSRMPLDGRDAYAEQMGRRFQKTIFITMPRKPRLFVPGVFVHIMARGIEGRDIFLDDQDRSLFLSLLGSGIRKSEYRLHAWALMRNHYHLLVRTSEHPLSDLMRRLNSTYAQQFSRKCGRRGYLFQDRYKSLVTQDQYYVEELLRYVHLNPVRAGVCANTEELDGYRWTGHAVLMNRQECSFQDTWTVLRRFGRTAELGRSAYRNFMAQGVEAGNEGVSEIGGTVRRADTGLPRRDEPDRWVIGDSDFVNRVLASDKESRLRLARHRVDNVTIEDVAVKACAAFGVEVEQLRRRTRATRLAEIRKVFAHLCRSGYGFAVVDIGRYLGTSGPPMSVRITEGAALAKKSPYSEVIRELWS